MTKFAIIGAGVSGLSAARRILAQQPDADVTSFDKSRGVGGRMSTRYAGDYEFDHGAQYFTVSDTDFAAEISRAESAGAAARWSGRALYLQSGALTEDTGHPRYVGAPRMNSLPKFWAEGLTVELGQRVTTLTRDNGQWDLAFENGAKATGYDRIICTLPPEQARLLLPAKSSLLPTTETAQMSACFALMIGLASPIDTGWDSLRINDLPACWIAVNHAKPGRSQTVGTIVVHSAPEWSDIHAEADRNWVAEQLRDCASALIGMPLEQASHQVLHRWLYASVKDAPDTAVFHDPQAGLFLAGDWCRGGRVEGAWLAGRDAADAALA